MHKLDGNHRRTCQDLFLRSAQETKTPFTGFVNAKVKFFHLIKESLQQFICQLGAESVFFSLFILKRLFLIDCETTQRITMAKMWRCHRDILDLDPVVCVCGIDSPQFYWQCWGKFGWDMHDTDARCLSYFFLMIYAIPEGLSRLWSLFRQRVTGYVF